VAELSAQHAFGEEHVHLQWIRPNGLKQTQNGDQDARIELGRFRPRLASEQPPRKGAYIVFRECLRRRACLLPRTANLGAGRGRRHGKRPDGQRPSRSDRCRQPLNARRGNALVVGATLALIATRRPVFCPGSAHLIVHATNVPGAAPTSKARLARRPVMRQRFAAKRRK